MGSHDRGINEQVFHIRVALHRRGNPFEYPLLAPTGESYIRPMPMPEFSRQVAPRTPRTHDPEDSFEEAPIVPRRDAPIAGLAWQQFFNAFPLVISQHLSIHPAPTPKQDTTILQPL
jgi:hypothetical protein